jgi:nitroreductase
MIRSFETTPIPPDVRDRILSNAQRAPSGGFSQGWGFLVIEEPGALQRFWQAAVVPDSRAGSSRPGVSKAPLVIVPLSHKRSYLERYSAPDKQWTGMADETRWPAPYWDIDTGFASLLMLLTCVDTGLGALFFGIQRERFETLRAEFGIPEEYHPIGAIAIGYPAADAERPSLAPRRKPPEQVLHFNHW